MTRRISPRSAKEWTATSAATKVEDGIDTFIFRDGQIRPQTFRYTVQHIS
jgi:hypothetical protein